MPKNSKSDSLPRARSMGFVRNCYFMLKTVKPGEKPVTPFVQEPAGTGSVYAHLEGYAIIPWDVFQEMCVNAAKQIGETSINRILSTGNKINVDSAAPKVEAVAKEVPEVPDPTGKEKKAARMAKKKEEKCPT